MKNLFIVFLFFAFNLNAQISPFKIVSQSGFDGATYATANLRKLKKVDGRLFEIELPTDEGTVIARVSEQFLFTSDFALVDSKGKEHDFDSRHFSGHLASSSGSIVTVSLYEESLYAYIHDEGETWTIAPRSDGDKYYRIARNYDEEAFQCEKADKQFINNYYVPQEQSECNTVGVYFECDNDMFKKNGGSITKTMQMLSNIFVNVQKIYQNDGMAVAISKVKIWDTLDPYAEFSTSSINALNRFRTEMNKGFEGDLAHLLSSLPKNNGGVAYVDVLCRNKAYSIAYSNIKNSYQNFPNYSWDVMVIAHEMGHNLGSPHTQNCSWTVNGVANQAIDGCYNVEGSCNRPAVPSDGGTVMSYCHLTSVGINLNKGFGELPRSLLLGKINAATCLTGCDDEEFKADLRAISGTLEVGSSIRISNIISSSSEASSSFNVEYRLNNIPRIHSGDVLLTARVGGIDKDGQFNLITEKSTSSLKEGEYWLSARIDSRDEVIESNEANNLYFFGEKVVIKNGGVSYCDAKGTNGKYEWIEKFAVNDYENNTGSDNYTLYTTPLQLMQNTEHEWSLGIGYQSNEFDENLGIWIDYNQDGVFDAEEKIAKDGSIKKEASGVFQVSEQANLGKTRMRVKLYYNLRNNDPCGDNQYGEVEDYEIEITPYVQPCEAPEFATVCWRSSKSVTIDWIHEEEIEKFFFRYKRTGGEWFVKELAESMITIDGLDEETFYEYQVRADCSDWTASYEFSTDGLCFDPQKK